MRGVQQNSSDTISNQHSGGIVQAVIAALFILALSLGIAQYAHAQQSGTSESVALSPSTSKFTIDAGKTSSGKLTLVNDGTSAYDLLVYARPYSIANNDYQNPDFTSAKKNADLYAWVQFAQTKYHIDAGKTIEVPYTIRVPAGAAPGGHYGVIFAEIQSTQQSSSGNSVLRKKRVGSIIYATVNGEVRLTGDFAGGEVPFWQVQPPLTTTVSAKSTGNTDIVDTVRLTVRDVLGNIKYQATKDYHILPGTLRTMDLQWSNASWFGLYHVEAEQKFLSKSDKVEGYVLIMPRYVPIALLLILAGGVYVVVRRKKK